MRSRFAAFALGLAPYLLASWHPSTRPAELDLDDGTMWRRLQIVDTVAGRPGDEDGVVEFRASFRDENGAGLLHERSRFLSDGAGWQYVDGTLFDSCAIDDRPDYATSRDQAGLFDAEIEVVGPPELTQAFEELATCYSRTGQVESAT